MKFEQGLYMPEHMQGVDRYFADLEGILPFLPDGRSVVQAGGHIGIFPYALSQRYRAVYTFEPELDNFECLVRNVPAKHVFPFRALLGVDRGPKELRVHSRSTGGHSVGKGEGLVPMLLIDDLGLKDCDAIVLDLEGYDLYALMGAYETIVRCRPIIVVEENKKMHGQGVKSGDIAKLLYHHGYKQPQPVGENLCFRP